MRFVTPAIIPLKLVAALANLSRALVNLLRIRRDSIVMAPDMSFPHSMSPFSSVIKLQKLLKTFVIASPTG